MELPLRLQAAQFAAALLFGLLCGVVYDLLRAPRRRIPALTVPADLLYALFLLLGLLALALYVGGGRLRLFFYPAIALGAAVPQGRLRHAVYKYGRLAVIHFDFALC